MPENETVTTGVEETEEVEIATSEEPAANPIEPEAPAAQTESSEPAQATTSSEPAPPAASSSDDAAFKKRVRTLWIVGGVIIAIALIIAAFIITNLLADNALREQAEADLAQSPEITELVLPNKWVEQTGFELKEVLTADVDRADPNGPGTAEVRQIVTVANENVQSINSLYRMRYTNDNGAWKLQSIETLSQEFFPIASISDEDIESAAGSLLQALDELNAAEGYWSINLTTYYGDSPTIEIFSNDWDFATDDVVFGISAVHNDRTLNGEIEAIFDWKSIGEEPGWDLSIIEATPSTYYQTRSEPQEGVSAFSSAEEQQSSRDTSVAWNHFFISFFTEVYVEDGYAVIGFENVPNNTVDQECTITLDSTGEVLYQSDRISPGHVIDVCQFARPLDPGVYDATMTITCYERGTNRLVSMNSKTVEPITIKVRSK